jgi:hypothetical protein
VCSNRVLLSRPEISGIQPWIDFFVLTELVNVCPYTGLLILGRIAFVCFRREEFRGLRQTCFPTPKRKWQATFGSKNKSVSCVCRCCCILVDKSGESICYNFCGGLYNSRMFAFTCCRGVAASRLVHLRLGGKSQILSSAMNNSYRAHSFFTAPRPVGQCSEVNHIFHSSAFMTSSPANLWSG